eukprot:CAMPEP_0171108166 /NCGR_PEP_ID=MMETSP0766_2-20121228/68330_1 /TAXON_ID=439317 /ORGANISM="Gambierdiscus australes, Strain CAWD 149" /LENGTH=212 /DNA_ID=CAMNT_0011569619 /DNA_START=143 /DNA_END=781 /DNA_ORIENTATION=+
MVQEARSFARNNSLTDEESLTDLVDALCSLKKKEGRWLLRLDIAEVLETSDTGIVGRLMSWVGLGADSRENRHTENRTLAIRRMGQMGECRGECLVLHKACKQVLKGKEETLISLMVQSKGVASMREKLCKRSCERKKGLPKLGDWVDEAFVPKDEKDVEMEDLMERMKADTGMGMKMYKREDLQSMSEGDMETMAAREAYAHGRRAAAGDL